MAAAATLTLPSALGSSATVRILPLVPAERIWPPRTIPLAPQLSSKRKSGHSLPGLFESYRGTPRQHHCALCAFFSARLTFRAATTLIAGRLLFVVWGYRGRAVVLTAHLRGNPAHNRETLFHGSARLVVVIEGRGEGKKTRGERSFRNAPDATKRRGFTFHL